VSEPIHIISLGAGVQSSTMALMAACGEITPMPVAAIFADTQAEPKSVYTWLDWLEKQLPFPVIRVTAGSLTQKALTPYRSVKNNKMYYTGLPIFLKNPDSTLSISPRQCTRDFKVDPVRRASRKLMIESGGKEVSKWIGISLDEIYRMKEPRRKYEAHRYPLIEARMSRHDCLRWMEARQFPEPPRSACVYCPYHNNTEWKRLKEQEPEEFEMAVRFEKDFQQSVKTTGLIATPFLHRSLVPLSEVDFSTEEERGQLNMFNNECEGMCGV